MTLEIIGMVLGGTSLLSIIGAIVYYRPRLKTEQLSAKDKDIEVATRAMTLVNILESRLNEKAELITKLEKSAYLNCNKLKAQGWTIQEHERKLNGMQKAMDIEISKKKQAEKFVCFNVNCPVREPQLGTFDEKNPPLMNTKLINDETITKKDLPREGLHNRKTSH